MSEFTIHPNVYSTGKNNGLLSLLEQIWIKETAPGKVVSSLFRDLQIIMVGCGFMKFLDGILKKEAKS